MLPDILGDKQRCRQRLLEILNEVSGFRVRDALMGLVKLGVSDSDEEVVEAAVEKYISEASSSAAFMVTGDIITHFPNHPKVREFALYQ